MTGDMTDPESVFADGEMPARENNDEVFLIDTEKKAIAATPEVNCLTTLLSITSTRLGANRYLLRKKSMSVLAAHKVVSLKRVKR